VVAIVVLNSGSGYTGTPTVTIDAPSKSLGLKIELIPKLTVEGPVGQSAIVEWASELIGPWTAWSNVVVGAEGTVLVDLTPGAAGRFYRAQAYSKPAGPNGFVWIPPGTFVMGSPLGEIGRRDTELQHKVTLTEGFWMSDHEVTQSEYFNVQGNNPSSFKDLQSSNRPVEMVTWADAVQYCQNLTTKERSAGRITALQQYRLPTEAEWEYSARAGLNGARYGVLDETAWWSGNSDKRTHFVKQKQPNAWGLYDMLGNVSELCFEGFQEYGDSDVVNPKGSGESSFFNIIRGGDWYWDGDSDVRFAARGLIERGGKSI
jgi:formylglycine-generating enzyme required for sulfatase activity